MSGANHIVGGTVFTGIFASFWNVNIFGSPALLFFTAFFSILADVDHLKSPIGKLFYPLAKYLDRRFGHRTITHSLACYLALLLFVALIEKASGSENITLVCAFAYLSHLIFDMLTRQGVPLFYPFKKNACVIPANPELRFKSSDIKTESIIFFVFCMLGFSCQNLFANGFWTTYNNQYSDLKHLHQESILSPQLLEVKYSFTNELGKTKNGKGIVINSSETNCILLDSLGFTEITKTHKISQLSITRNERKKAINELFFYNISSDSLAHLVKEKAILNLKFQSSTDVSYLDNNVSKSGSSINLEFIKNPVFTFSPDTNKKEILKRIELLKHELLQIKLSETKLRASENAVDRRINTLSVSIPEMGVYDRENATKELAKLKQEKERFAELEKPNSGKILIQLRHLESELAKETAFVNGYISYLTIR